MRLTYWTLTLIPAMAAAMPAPDASQVTIASPVINATFATATITVPTDDRLEGLSAPGGIAHLHTIKRNGMVVTPYIPFSANVPRRLSKYGYHIMLMRKLPVGSTLPITLIFRDAGAMRIEFKVAS